MISPEPANILRRRAHLPIVRLALDTLTTFQPTRYFKRWARRLCHEGFTHEDAKVIALGTFGVDEFQSQFGVDALVTGDLNLIRNYEQRLTSIQRRLRAMTAQLSEPFCYARLPVIITPAEAAERLAADVISPE
ncbi:MAG: hypothetical protein HY784_02840 [Chloroflexi bacterium]|nr:hypothetical protein [Chloroflexota bacterium]